MVFLEELLKVGALDLLEHFLEGHPLDEGQIHIAAAALVAEHMLSGDTRPLLLSPFTNPVLDRVLVNRFSAPDGQTVRKKELNLACPGQ